jgi:diguanylate cyclase (GGDEF)-like protein
MTAVRRMVFEAATRIWRSPSLQIALVLLPIVWTGYFAMTRSERADAFLQASSHGDSVAKLFQENTERIFELVDQSLLVMRAMQARDPAGFSLKSWANQARIVGGDLIQIAVIGSDGYLVDTTTGYSGPPLYLGDREHFVKTLQQAEDRLYVAKPVLGRASGRWTIQVARKLSDVGRTATGVIVGSIDVDLVGRFYDTAKLGDGGSLVLRNTDFVVLAARGIEQNSFLGQRVPGHLERQLQEAPIGQYWSDGRPDRSNRLITARKSTLFPLIFTVGISEKEIYSRYWHRQKLYLVSAFLLTFIIVAATTFYWRRQEALDRAQRQLHDSLNNFADALRNMPQGLSMFDGSDRLIAFNQLWLDAHGLRPDDIRVGMKFQEVFANQQAVSDLDGFLADFKMRLATSEHTSNTVTFPDGRVISISYGRRQGGGWVATHEDITQRRASEERIEKLAHYDSLTGLANRNLFKERIDQALARYRRANTRFAVLLLDLDKFKPVNDALGHQSGDSLLREVAKRIKAESREVDTAARIGGDEFALIVMPDQDALEDGAAALANRLINTIAAPFQIEDHPVVIGCSIGIALMPEHGTSTDEILRNADLALYRSKNSGRNRFSVCSRELKAEADQRNMLEIELREAIWRDEIEVFYQPVVELGSGQVRSVEALARWRHKTRGFIPPVEFIAIAEESGLIVELGNLVLAKACRDAATMPESIKVAINLSAIQFIRSDIVEAVIQGLAASGLPESRLELEITESVFLADSEDNLKKLQYLRSLGVSIALDDFGVGYSSLSYLTAFPFNRVKIDKSFIDRINRSETVAVLASIVQLAKTLNLSIVAEGIETSEQVQTLRSLGIPFGQGYLFGKPAPLAELGLEPHELTKPKAAAGRAMASARRTSRLGRPSA